MGDRGDLVLGALHKMLAKSTYTHYVQSGTLVKKINIERCLTLSGSSRDSKIWSWNETAAILVAKRDK